MIILLFFKTNILYIYYSFTIEREGEDVLVL